MENLGTTGENKNFRQFRELNDLILYMQQFQKRYNFPNYPKFATVNGILQQFYGFDLDKKFRNRDEVAVYFFEEDPKDPIKPNIEFNMMWFNNKTKKVLLTPPDWFIENKKKIINSWN